MWGVGCVGCGVRCVGGVSGGRAVEGRGGGGLRARQGKAVHARRNFVRFRHLLAVERLIDLDDGDARLAQLAHALDESVVLHSGWG